MHSADGKNREGKSRWVHGEERFKIICVFKIKLLNIKKSEVKMDR